MTDNDSRCRDEIDELARLLTVPAGRDLPADRNRSLREHLMNEFRSADVGARRASNAGRARLGGQHPKRGLLGAAAGAAALAAATLVVVATLGPAGTSPSAGSHTQHAAAIRLLAEIADVAGSQPSPAVRDSQYAYIKTVESGIGVTHAAKVPAVRAFPSAPPTGKLVSATTQEWSSVSDVCRPGLMRNGSNRGVPFSAQGPGTHCPSIGGLNDPTYRLLQSLPTNPLTLLKLIYATEKGHGPTPDLEAFVTIGDLLRGSIAPPGVSAALYRAAALIPGVTVVRDAVNATGQHGVGVALAGYGASSSPGSVREEWIFNKTSLQLIGESIIANGAVTYVTAIVDRAFVDHLGQLPAVREPLMGPGHH